MFSVTEMIVIIKLCENLAKRPGMRTNLVKYASKVSVSQLQASLTKLSKKKGTSTPSSVSLLQKIKVIQQVNDMKHPLLEDSSEPTLIKTLTNEAKASLIGNVTAKKLRMEALTEWLKTMHENSYMLPASLSSKQWNQLLQYDSLRAVTFYLDAILNGKDEDPETLKTIADVNEECYKPLTANPEDYKNVVGDDQELELKWQQICAEYENLQMEGRMMWPFPDLKELQRLMSATDISDELKRMAFQRKMLLVSYVKERAVELKYLQQNRKKKEVLESTYCLHGNSIFTKYSQDYMENVSSHRLIGNFQTDWETPFVIDATQPITWTSGLFQKGYFRQKIVDQVCNALKRNHECFHPFSCYLTNVEEPKLTGRLLDQKFNIISDGFAEITEQCYSELFPKERLVYVTKIADRILTHNPNDIYVIGFNSMLGRCDDHEGVAKAKKLGIRVCCLPILQYTGYKVPVETVDFISILLDFHRTNDWQYSFRWIPPLNFKLLFSYKHSLSSHDRSAFLAQTKLYPQSFLSDIGMMQPEIYEALYNQLKAANHHGIVDIMSTAEIK